MATPSETEKKIVFKESDILGLVKEVNRVFGSGSGIIFNYAGFGIGQSIAGEEVPSDRREAFNIFQKAFEERGLGKALIEITDSSSSSGKVSFTELPFKVENPLHEVLEMLVRGIFQGFLATVFKKNKIVFVKEQCVNKGDNACVFSFRVE